MLAICATRASSWTPSPDRVAPCRCSPALAYLDSEFTEYPDAANLPGLGGTQDLKGKAATFAPKWSGRVGFDWTGEIGSSGLSWDFNSNLSFVSKQYGGLVNDANPQTLSMAMRCLAPARRSTGRTTAGRSRCSATTCTDKQYEAGNLYQFLEGSLGLRNGVFPGSTAVRRLHADPRSYGVAATFRF